MSPVGMALYAFALPFLSAALTFLIARWLGRRVGLEGADRLSVALGTGVGYLAGHAGVAWPEFPPNDVTDRIPWIAAVVTVIATLDAARPGPAWTRWENRLLLTVLVLSAVLGPIGTNTSTTRDGRVWLAAMGFVTLASWTNLEALSARLSAGRLGPALLVIAFGAGGVLVVSGSMVLGQLGVALAAALGAIVSLNLKAPVLVGAAPVTATTLGALLLDSYIYAGLPASAAIALLTAPALLWVARLGPLQRLSSWKASLITAAVVLVPVGSALGLALAASPSFEE